MTIASINHIDVDDTGVARIAGTRLKVHHLVAVMHANDFTAAQLAEGFPQVTLAQIYAALAYYHDHKEQVDRQIADYAAKLEQSQGAAIVSTARGKALEEKRRRESA